MKNKTITVIRWIGAVTFALMAIYALSERAFLAAPLFLIGGLAITPLEFVNKLRSKLKFNKAITIALAVVLLFAGSLLTPTGDSADINDSKPTHSLSTENSSKKASSNDSSNKKSKSNSSKNASKASVSSVGNGKATPVSETGIPSYSGQAYAVINNNIPNFAPSELSEKGYEKYSDLDSKGRVGVALASLGKETMPSAGEDRGSISNVYPTGWKQAKYDNISGKYLYNRCHLIGWQLSAENANKRNLMTGTKYFNVSGMLPFENMVADYIKETNHHVAYRVTPIFEGDNLLASGVQIEAYSVEDSGKGICFNVYCFNIQPEININYADGSSSQASSTPPATTTPAVTPSQASSQNESSKNSVTVPQAETGENLVWIPIAGGTKYHTKSSCSNMKDPIQVSEETAKANGYEPCKRCH